MERSLEQQKHIDLFVFSNLFSRWTHPKPENPRGAVTLMLGPMDSTEKVLYLFFVTQFLNSHSRDSRLFPYRMRVSVTNFVHRDVTFPVHPIGWTFDVTI